MPQRRGPYLDFIQYGFTELRRLSKDDVPDRSWTRSQIIEAANAQLAAAGQSRGRQAIPRYDEGLAQWELNSFIERQDESPDDTEPSFSITPLGAEMLDGLLAIGNTLPEPNTAGGSSRSQREIVKKRMAGAARRKSRVLAAGINALRKKHFIRTSGFQKYTLASVNALLQRQKKVNTLQAARLRRTGSITNARSRAGSVATTVGGSTSDGASIPQVPTTPIRRRLTAQGSILAQGLPPTPGPEPEPQEDNIAADDMDVDVDLQVPETVDMSVTPVAPQRSIDSSMAYPSPMSIQRPALVNMDAQPEPPNVDQAQETPSRGAQNTAEQSTSTSYLGSIFRSLRFPGLGGSSSSNQSDVDEANRKVTELEGLLKEAQAQLEAVISEKDDDIMDLQGQRAQLQRQLHEVEQELDDVKRELSDTMAKLEGVRYQNSEQARTIERLETIERTMSTIARAITANPNTMQMVDDLM